MTRAELGCKRVRSQDQGVEEAEDKDKKMEAMVCNGDISQLVVYGGRKK